MRLGMSALHDDRHPSGATWWLQSNLRLPPVQSSTASLLLVFARPPLGIPVDTASASAWFPSTYQVTSLQRIRLRPCSGSRNREIAGSDWPTFDRARPVPQPFAYAWTRATPPQNNWGYGASRAERRPYPSRPHDTLLDLLSWVGGRIGPSGRAGCRMLLRRSLGPAIGRTRGYDTAAAPRHSARTMRDTISANDVWALQPRTRLALAGSPAEYAMSFGRLSEPSRST